VYQAWHSVLAWITLEDDEALFLEAAEDIDRRRGDEIVTGQVKDYPDSSLTLGAGEARTALKNFWKHREMNPGLRVSLRYLTRARRGREQKGLPSGRLGLEVWDLALHDNDALQELRTYLQSADLEDTDVSRDLSSFLKTASDAELREQLIDRVRWDTEAPSHGDLKGIVGRLLTLHGSRHGVLPTLAASVAEPLFAEAIKTASEPGDRRLTREDFLRIFEDRTVGLGPALDRATIANVATQIAATPPPRRTPGEAGFLEAVTGSALASPLERPHVVKGFLELLEQSSLVAVHGSSGMGKSTLADLAAAVSPAPWVSLDLRGLEKQELADRLDEAALAVASLRLGTVVVADDLTSPDDRAEAALRRLFGSVRARQGRLVVTTHTPLPHPLAALVAADPNFAAPPLDHQDLHRLVLGRGCPPDRAEGWATLALIRTSGHPLLADVYAREAQRTGWPHIRAEDLTMPVPPIADVQRVARTRLRDALPADAAALVMRLSVFTVPFKRDQALRLALTPPPVPGAGDSIDRLLGPWIEPYGQMRYRVSPLLKGAFASDLPSEDQKRLHADAADALMSPDLTGVDLSGVLSHGIIGENGTALFGAYVAISGAEETVMEGVAPYIEWFPSVCTDDSYALLFPGDTILSLTLRVLQFEVAKMLGRDHQALAVLDAWERDLAGATDLPPDAQVIFDFQLRTLLVTTLDAPVGLGRAARAAQVILSTNHSGLVSEAIEGTIPDKLYSVFENLSPAALTEFLAFRCTRAPHLAALLALDLSEPLRSAVEDALRARYSLTIGIVGRIWSNESREDTPDWPAILHTLSEVGDAARGRGLHALTVATALGQAIVHAEYLDDSASALRALDAADEATPSPDPRVTSYRAKVHALYGDHVRALGLFESVLPRWSEVSDNDALGVPGSSLAYDFADAIRSAGALGRYTDAAQWAVLGAEAAAPMAGFVPSLRVGYLAERALAHALDGDVCGAIELVVPILEDLPDPDTSVLRKLYRRLTVLIAWLEEKAGGRSFVFRTPELGQISRTDEDEFEDVELMPVPALWAALGEAERHADCGTSVLERARTERTGVPEHVSTLAGYFSDMMDLIQNAPPELPDKIARLLQVARSYLGDIPHESPLPPLREVPGGNETLVYVMSLAMTKSFADGVADGMPLYVWRRRSEEVGADMSLIDEWFGIATLAIAHTLGDRDAASYLWDVLTSSGTPALRWTAGLAFVVRSRTPLERLIARAFITEAGAQPPFRPAIARAVATLVGVDISSSHRDGIHAAAEAVLSDTDASQIPLSMAGRLTDLANGKDRRTDPAPQTGQGLP
jgi:hypothetical protein